MFATGWKKIVFAIWLLLWPLLLAMHLYPIRIAALRLGLLLVVFLIWLGILLLCWNRKPIRWTWLLISFIFIMGCLWPRRTYNSQILRQEYIYSLQAYKGVTYVWGGETKRGIDCSGLMRCGLVDADLKRGIATSNPSLLRAGFSLWWNDCSALALKQEFQNRTRLLFTSASINAIDEAKIKPGDIAVTSNGVHVLAYMGHKTWIEADPNEGVGHQVIEVKIPSRNAWFNTPVHVMRWRQLE
jgi:hypothetical protein